MYSLGLGAEVEVEMFGVVESCELEVREELGFNNKEGCLPGCQIRTSV